MHFTALACFLSGAMALQPRAARAVRTPRTTARNFNVGGMIDGMFGKKDAEVTETVFFDIAIGDAAPQRVELGLYGSTTPRTCENFKKLCTGEPGFGFKGSKFHRIIPGFMCQGGDVTNGDGTGGASIYGGTFDDEAFPFAHAYSGLVAMANSGPNTNKSQFYVTLADCTWLDGKHVVFGRVTKGMTETVRSIEKLGSNSGDLSGECTIVRCGVVGAE
mmetsp:Transcript_30534/g.91553  ORF Transcript_30534/g.91553 Transcript_30534/m.91553 type:complete len:218 (-) Transcript_30534:29-682(-)